MLTYYLAKTTFVQILLKHFCYLFRNKLDVHNNVRLQIIALIIHLHIDVLTELFYQAI